MTNQQKEKRPAAAATAQDARKEVVNGTSDSTPAGVSSQALAVENIIRLIRRHETSTGQIWPGDAPEPPRTCYPNLAAEILAARYFLWCPAEQVGVTKQLLADALEAGAKLNPIEISNLAKLFGCSIGYLLAPRLQIVDPKRRNGRIRAKNVCDAADAFRADFGPGKNLTGAFYQNIVGRAEDTARRLCRGQSVTYADYRRALLNLRDARRFLTKPVLRGREATA